MSLLLEGVVCFLGITSYSKASGFCFFWGLGNRYQLKLRLLFLQEKQCFPFQVFTRQSWEYLQSQLFMKLGVSSKSGVHEDGSRTELVKVNHKAQVTAHSLAAALNTVNPRDTMSEQLMDEAVNLDAPEVMHTVGKRTKGVINVSLSTPQFSGNHNIENQGVVFSAKEFNARINEIDSEMGKFDHINCMTQPSNISQDILSEAREKHVLAKPQSQRQVFNMVNIPDKEKSTTTTMKGNEPN